MITINTYLELITLLSIYLFFYNLSLVVIFLNFFSFINTKIKTIFSFNEFKLNFFLLSTTFIAILSMAGVPPFIGFFSKLFLLILLSSSYIATLYIPLLILLFFGLYFYTQNLRYILTSNNKNTNYAFNENLRLPSLFFFIVTNISFLTTLGLFFLDDFILIFYWIFS